MRPRAQKASENTVCRYRKLLLRLSGKGRMSLHFDDTLRFDDNRFDAAFYGIPIFFYIHQKRFD